MRMKKCFALFLALILCLSACPSLAEVISEVSDAGSIDWDTTDVYLNMLGTANGKIYGSSGTVLYELDTANPGKYTAAYRLDLPEREYKDEVSTYTMQESVYALTGDETTLYGLVGDVGSIHALTLAGDTITVGEPLAQLKEESDGSYLNVLGFVAVNDAFYLLTPVDDSSWGKNDLWELKRDGTKRKVASGAYLALSAYKDNALLVMYWDQENAYSGDEITMPVIQRLDIATGETTDCISMTDTNMTSFCYDAASDTLYIPTQDTLYRSVGFGALEPCAYLNLQYISWGTNGLVLDGKFYIATSFNGNGWSCANTDPSLMPARALRIGTSFRDDTMAGFMNAHPDIPIVLADVNSFSADQLAQSMVSGNDAADIYSLSLSYGSFDQLRQKGYCVDLSNSEVLLNAVKQMNPDFTASFYQDGKLYAFPESASAIGFGYSPSALEKIGLTEDDLPKTYLEFIDFAVMWIEDYADEYPDLSLFEYNYDVRNMFIGVIISRYVAYTATTGENLNFDTPLMHKLLNKLDSALPKLKELNPEDENQGFGMGFVTTSGGETTSLFTESMDLTPQQYTWGDYKPLLLPLDEGLEPAETLNLQIYLVNPNSECQREAITFLEYLAEHMDETTKIALYPDENTPVEDPHMARYLADAQKQLEDAKASKETADDADKRNWDDTISMYEDNIAYYESNLYFVSADAIAQYRSIEPYLHVYTNSLYASLSTDGAKLLQRYLDNEINSDQFIKEFNRIIRMIQLENQ